MRRFLSNGASLPLDLGICTLTVANPWATILVLTLWLNVMIWPVVGIVTAVRILA